MHLHQIMHTVKLSHILHHNSERARSSQVTGTCDLLMKAEEESPFAIGSSGDGKLSDGNLSNTGCHFIGIFQEELDGFLEVR